MDKKIAWLLAFLSFLLCSCATLPESLGGQITISTYPNWAQFRLVGDPTIYNTPAALNLTRTGPALVRIEKDGYEPVLLRISAVSTAFGMPANGSSANWSVEALSEAQYRLIGDTLIVVLKEVPQPVLPPALAPAPEPQPEVPLMHKAKPRKSLKNRLKELEVLKKKGKISAKQYKALKKKAYKEYK